MAGSVCWKPVLVSAVSLSLLFACVTADAGLGDEQHASDRHMEEAHVTGDEGPTADIEACKEEDGLSHAEQVTCSQSPDGSHSLSSPQDPQEESPQPVNVISEGDQSSEQESAVDEETSSLQTEQGTVKDNEESSAPPEPLVSDVSDEHSGDSEQDGGRTSPVGLSTEEQDGAGSPESGQAVPSPQVPLEESTQVKVGSDGGQSSEQESIPDEQTDFVQNEHDTVAENIASHEPSLLEVPAEHTVAAEGVPPSTERTSADTDVGEEGRPVRGEPENEEADSTEPVASTAEQSTNDSEASIESQPHSQVSGEQQKVDAEEKPTVSYIPELSSNIMNPGRLLNASWFILFYAPWCEFSQAARPMFLEAVQHMLDRNITGVYIGKIDVSKHGEVVSHFKIRSTPTILFYHMGIKYEFQEEVTVENLKSFMITILSAGVTQVSTGSELAEHLEANPVIFLLVHEGEEEFDRDWQGTFSKVAREKALRGKFFFTTNPEIVKEFHFTSFPTIAVFKDGRAHQFNEALSAYALNRWVTSERYVAFPTANTTTLRSYLKLPAGRRLVVLVVDEEPSRQTITQKKAIEVVRKVALSRRLLRGFQCILLQGVEMAEKMLQQSLVELPALFAYELHSGYYYIYQPSEEEKGMTEKSVVEFFERVKKGEAKRQGGTSYKNTFDVISWRIYATVQTMITHRPILSLATALCMLGVVLFYLHVWYHQKPKKLKRVHKAAVARRRQRPARRRGRDQGGEGSNSGTDSVDQSLSEPESSKDK